MASQVTDDDIRKLSSNMNEMTMSLEEFSIPYISGLGSQSLLEKSQYGKVIFHDIQDSYPTDGDVLCKYTLTDGVCYAHGDRINIYKVGWRHAVDFFHSMWAPQPDLPAQAEFQVLFKASNLPKDDQIYQFCYMTANDEMRGASGPFQFHQPYDNDLCTVEEQDGLVIVRSRSSVAEEKLREAQQNSLTLQREKTEVEVQLQEFTKMLAVKNKEKDDLLAQLSAVTKEKEELAKRLEECSHLERHMDRLQKELQALDTEKMELQAKLHKSEAQIQALTVSLETLNNDKENVSQQLREATQNTQEVAQLRSKLEDQLVMISVLTSSKEMITKELRLEITANEKHQNMVKALTDEKKELEEKIADLEKRLGELNCILRESVQKEQSFVDLMDKMRDQQKSHEDSLERQARLLQEVTELQTAKKALQASLDELQLKFQKEKSEHVQEIKSMRDLLGQLAKGSQREAGLTQELEQLKAEKAALQLTISQMQQEKLEHAKEMKTLRDLLEQLAKDSHREVGLAQEIEQLKTEKAAIQQALEEAHAKMVEQAMKAQEMIKKHDGMLAELIHLTGKDKSSEAQVSELEAKLKEANDELTKLRDIRTKSEDMKCLADVMLSRATLQRRIEQMEAEEKISNKRLIVLQDRIELLQKETIRLQSLVDASEGHPNTNCFGELFSNVEQQKCALEAQLKEFKDGEEEQSKREKTIAARLEEVTVEVGRINAEREEVQCTYLTSNAQLKELRERYQTLTTQASGFATEVDDWSTVGSPLELSRIEDEIQDAECFVESSHMRIMQLEQRCQELGQERAVLDAQHQTALQRAQRHADDRKALHKQLTAIHDSERILLRQHLDVVSSPVGAEGNADKDRDAVLSKLEDTAAISQNCGNNSQELTLRLKLAAAEYRKLYAEKQKADRRLRKLYQRLGDKQATNTSATGTEVPTAELVNISTTATEDSSSSAQATGSTSFSFICPFCSTSFPRADCEVFMEHFDNHLS